MKYFILGIITGCIIIYLCTLWEKNNTQVDNELQKISEEAYFDGQRDAINGDIRIKFKDTSYIWIKSPWENSKAPIFIPNKKNSKK